MHTYLTGLCAELVRASGMEENAQATLQIEVEQMRLPTEHGVAVALVVNELVMNALKHAQPASGPAIISVRLVRHGAGQVRLTVADNGATAGTVVVRGRRPRHAADPDAGAAAERNRQHRARGRQLRRARHLPAPVSGVMAATVLIVEDQMLIAWHLSDLIEGAGHRVLAIARDPAEAMEAAATPAARLRADGHPLARRHQRPGGRADAVRMLGRALDLHQRQSRSVDARAGANRCNRWDSSASRSCRRKCIAAVERAVKTVSG